MDVLLEHMTHGPFWTGVLQIILLNIILSGDNAVVIAMACLTLPPKQRVWGMILGSGVAVLLRVILTFVISEAMEFAYLTLVGGALLERDHVDRHAGGLGLGDEVGQRCAAGVGAVGEHYHLT